MGIGLPIKKVLDEKDVLKKLDIQDFRHMSKDKVMEFCSLYQQMDPEVAKAAIAQFPEFAKTLLAAAEDYKDVLQKGLDSADESTKAVFESYDLILEALRARVSDEELSEEDKRYYIDKMVDIAQMKSLKDKENKDFVLKIAGMAGMALVAVAGIAVAALGGKTDINLPSPK